MNIQVIKGKVVFQKMFNESEIHAASCMGFTTNDKRDTVVAKIDTTAKEAMMGFLKLCDKGLMESPMQSVQRGKLFSDLKLAYKESYDTFVRDFDPENLYKDVNRKLYKHQVETLWAYQKKRINLCSFEQGLGKTIFAASISKMFKVPRTIVIGPSLVKWNWVKDLSDEWGFNSMFFTVLDSKKCMYSIMHERFVILNYEMVTKFWKHLTSSDCGHIIIDESHYVKNHKSGRAKGVQKLIKHFPKARVTLLTGTPVTNRVTDLFSYLKMAQHPLGSNFANFKERYALGKQKVIGVKNPEDLTMRISNFIVRKKTKECIDLPELRINKYYFDMDDASVTDYNKMMDDLYEVEEAFQSITDRLKQAKEGVIHLSINEKKDMNAELRSLRMKKKSSIHTMNRLCANAKIPNIIKLIDDLNEKGEKVIVFSGYTEPMHTLKDHYGDAAVLIDGSVSSFKRQAAIEQFKKDPNVKVFIGQFIAGGIGINLVNSSKTIFTNFPFTPDLIEQPMKRSHRGGQTKDVDIFFTMIKDSIDEQIYRIIRSKGDDINQIIDHDKEDKMEYGSLESRLFNDLFSSYRKSKGIAEKVTDGFVKVK